MMPTGRSFHRRHCSWKVPLKLANTNRKVPKPGSPAETLRVCQRCSSQRCSDGALASAGAKRRECERGSRERDRHDERPLVADE